MSWGFNNRGNVATCPHSNTVKVSTAGLERTVCEFCGHVSVAFTSDSTSVIDRDSFARPADETSAHQVSPKETDESTTGALERFASMA